MRIITNPTARLIGTFCIGGVLAAASGAFAAQPSASISAQGHGKASLKAMLKQLGLNPTHAQVPAITVRSGSSTSSTASPFDQAASNVRWNATKYWPASDQGQSDPVGEPQPKDEIRFSWTEGCYSYNKTEAYLHTPKHGYTWVNINQGAALPGSNWQNPASFSCTPNKPAAKTQSR